MGQRFDTRGAVAVRVIAAAVIVVGLALTIFGIEASRSFSSEVSKVFTGNPTNHAMWLLVGGCGLIVAGAVGLFAGGKR
jgi:hypothetical protein